MRVLSPREIAIWRALPDDAIRATAFLRAWTRKEAYVKAIGEGLYCGLQSIEVALDATHPQPSLTIRSSAEDEKIEIRLDRARSSARPQVLVRPWQSNFNRASARRPRAARPFPDF